MYLCFCKAEDLQGYFLDCVYSECGADAEEAVDFGVDLCQGKFPTQPCRAVEVDVQLITSAELGVPITVPPRPTVSKNNRLA